MRRDPSSKEVRSLQCKYNAVEGRLEGVYGAVDVAMNDLTEKRTRIIDAYRAMQRDVESDSVNFVAGKHSKGSSCCGNIPLSAEWIMLVPHCMSLALE